MNCRYCGQVQEQGLRFVHENGCDQNPGNMADQEYTFACGHLGTRKPFSNDPDGSKIAEFLKERECTACFLRAYREGMARRTPEQIAEQRAEARAAFGPGVETTNVITGETWTT